MVPGAKRPPPIASELVNTGLLLEGDTRGRGEGALAVRGFGVAADSDDGFRVWPGGIVSRFPSASGSSPRNVAFESLSRGAPHFAQNRAVSPAVAPHEVQNMEPGFYHSHRRLIITRSTVCRLHLEYGSRKRCLPRRRVPLGWAESLAKICPFTFTIPGKTADRMPTSKKRLVRRSELRYQGSPPI